MYRENKHNPVQDISLLKFSWSVHAQACMSASLSNRGRVEKPAYATVASDATRPRADRKYRINTTWEIDNSKELRWEKFMQRYLLSTYIYSSRPLGLPPEIHSRVNNVRFIKYVKPFLYLPCHVLCYSVTYLVQLNVASDGGFDLWPVCEVEFNLITTESTTQSTLAHICSFFFFFFILLHL